MNYTSLFSEMAVNSTADSDDRDINDVFDAIVLSEEKVSEEEYQKGFDEAATAGNLEGYHLGYHRGAELGAELGYYDGLLQTHLNADSTSSPPERAVKVIATCLELIGQFPSRNDDQCDILQLADDIRAQFRKACALLKISGRYPEADQLSF